MKPVFGASIYSSVKWGECCVSKGGVMGIGDDICKVFSMASVI